MRIKLLSLLVLILLCLNKSTLSVMALPNLTGLTDENKIQVIDNAITESIEKINNLEEEVSNNELEIKAKEKEIFDLQKDYQTQKKYSNYSSSNFLRTNSSLESNGELKLFELLLNSDGLSDFLEKLETNKTVNFKKNRKAQLLIAKEDYLFKLQENLKKEQEKLISDKNDLLEEKNKLNELKKEVEEEIAKRPKILNLSNITPPDISVEASGEAKSIIEESFKYLGTPYIWGGQTPSGFDCSGFTQYVYGKFGVNLPRVSQSQQNFGTQIAISEVKPGDLLFNGYPAYHVSIYIGDGKYIHAPQTGDVIKISTVDWTSVSSASRVIN